MLEARARVLSDALHIVCAEYVLLRALVTHCIFVLWVAMTSPISALYTTILQPQWHFQE